MNPLADEARHRAEQAGHHDLAAAVLREVTPVFAASVSPRLTRTEIASAVGLLFEVLEHRLDDPNLDGVGGQILGCFARRFPGHERVKLADCFEPFAKCVMKLAEPDRYEALVRTLRNRFVLSEVLKAFGLASEAELKSWSGCAWQEFPPGDLVGKPDFKEQVGWTIRFRNTEAHAAPELDDVREAKLVQSVCVCLVWLTFRLETQLRAALLAARFSDHLQALRDRFADVGSRYVELFAEDRTANEYRFIDPLAAVPDTPSAAQKAEASTLPEVSRVTVIEAEPGAGKSTLLQFIAWQHADRLLSVDKAGGRLPVYLEMKLLEHRRETIECSVRTILDSGEARLSREVPWDSLLLLLDGLNEISPTALSILNSEVADLLAKHSKLRVLIAGRPNSFRGEFAARVVVLRRLTDQQLTALFRRAMREGSKADELLATVRQNAFLATWSRTPLHAAFIANLAQRKGIEALASHATAVRHFIRSFLNREASQTRDLTKERLLAGLAFEVVGSGRLSFPPDVALLALASAKARIGAVTVDLPGFIDEVLKNHVLQRSEAKEALEFVHELYLDYFAAAELQAREQSQIGLGAELALARFVIPRWHECIRLFAGLTDTVSVLIERGAERNPGLAWRLLRDMTQGDERLAEAVALAAYSVLEADLRSSATAALAGGCLLILADLGRADLVAQAILRQRQVLEPSGLWKLPEDERLREEARIQTTIVPLGYALICILRFGSAEQSRGQQEKYYQAGCAAIRALQRIRAARALVAILAGWAGSSFDSESLVPGLLLSTLIDLGVDKVLDYEEEAHTKLLAEWLSRASEAGFAKAWPAYGRLLRLAPEGVASEPEKALRWCRKAHEAGDAQGSFELALLLLEEPGLGRPGEGEQLLRSLSERGLIDAQYELGKRLLEGDGIAQDIAAGFAFLLAAAEAGHGRSFQEVLLRAAGWPLSGYPPWAEPLRERLSAVLRSRAAGLG